MGEWIRMKSRLTGKGIGVAVLDTGIYPHRDFDGRIIAFYDAVLGRTIPYDDNSHGTHVSGIIGGNGSASFGRNRGYAYEADLIGVKILGQNGRGKVQNALRGIEWVIANRKRYHIRVVNISVAQGAGNNEDEHPLVLAVEQMWKEGIVVVTAAGNEGPGEGTIGVPGNCRRIITVGAYDNLYGRDEKGNIRRFYSGRGTGGLNFIKPEIVAKGANVVSCNNTRNGYTVKSGSSMAAPYISAMIARLIQKYPDMQPVDVKLRLHDRAVDIGLPQNIQGWGTVDETFLAD